MIPKTVVDEYLKRRLDDHRWLKDLAEADVDRALAKLWPKPKFASTPWLHQKVCFLLGVAYPGFCYWVDMGGGKTILALELVRYWKQAGKLRGALGLSLDAERLYSWETDLAKFPFGLSHLLLTTGSTKDNWQLLEENDDTDLVLCPYPSFTHMVSDRVNVKKGVQLKASPKLADRWSAHVNVLCMDESTKAGAFSSETSKGCKLVGRRMDRRYAFAGVPFGRDPVLLRTQTNIVDQGETFGPSLDLFREAFFTKKRNYWAKSAHVFDYKFKTSMRSVLNDMLQHRSLAYETSEFRNTGKVVRKTDYVRFPDDAEVYYAKILAQMRKAKGNFAEMKNGFVRMRQISSGFVGFRDDETGDRAEIEFEHNPKLDRLLERIVDLPRGAKFLVLYEFTWSGRKIAEALTKLGVRHGWLWSGTKDPTQLQRAFDKDPDFLGLVANWRKGAYGLNGQAGNFEFFHESPVGCIDRQQAECRMDRPGQTKTVYIRDLVMRGTVDEKILSFHHEGRDLFKALMRDPDKVLTPNGLGIT